MSVGIQGCLIMHETPIRVGFLACVRIYHACAEFINGCAAARLGILCLAGVEI